MRKASLFAACRVNSIVPCLVPLLPLRSTFLYMYCLFELYREGRGISDYYLEFIHTLA